MPALLIPDVDEGVIARLQARANQNGRTVEDEAKAILETAAPKPHPAWETINKLREEIASSGRVFTDSVELLREDRDR